MFNLKEKLFGKPDKTAIPVNTAPKPNLPENFDSPVFGFVENNIQVQYTGDKDILQFLVAAGKTSKHARETGKDAEETAFFDLAKCINGSFACAMIKNDDLSKFLQSIVALGVEGADHLYFYTTDFVAHPDGKDNFTYSISGIFQKDDIKPAIIFWPSNFSVWVNSLLKNKKIEVYKRGQGYIAHKKELEKEEDTGKVNPISDQLFSSEIEIYQIETTVLQVIECCMGVRLLDTETVETPDRESVSKKLKDFANEEDESGGFMSKYAPK